MMIAHRGYVLRLSNAIFLGNINAKTGMLSVTLLWTDRIAPPQSVFAVRVRYTRCFMPLIFVREAVRVGIFTFVFHDDSASRLYEVLSVIERHFFLEEFTRKRYVVGHLVVDGPYRSSESVLPSVCGVLATLCLRYSFTAVRLLLSLSFSIR